MAVTKFEAGWQLTAAGDVAAGDSDGGATRNTNVSVDMIAITKTTAGTVTFKDGAGTTIFTTPTLGDGSVTLLNFRGAVMSGLEYDAVSAGSAVVVVIGSERPSRSVGV